MESAIFKDIKSEDECRTISHPFIIMKQTMRIIPMRDDHAPGPSARRHLHVDTSWNKQPEQARKEIADKAVWALHVILPSAAPTVSRTKSVACPLPARFSALLSRGHDYETSNPESGWIENGVIENCHDLNAQNTVGLDSWKNPHLDLISPEIPSRATCFAATPVK